MIGLATRDKRGPGQLIAVAVATAITVAVAVAASASIGLAANAAASQSMRGLAKADLVAVVTAVPGARQVTITAAQVETAITSTDGVSLASQDLSLESAISAGPATVPVLVTVTPSEQLAWASLKSGYWPRTAAEVVLSESLATSLGTSVGSNVTIARSSATLRVIGISDDSSGGVVYVTKQWFAAVVGIDDPLGDYAVLLRDGADPTVVANAISAKFAFDGYQIEAMPLAAATARASDSVGGELTTWRQLSWLITGLAGVAGIAWIATAFTALLAGRRRQLGMLRAVGASPAQLRGPILREAVLPGVLGSLAGVVLGLGLACLVAALTGSLGWVSAGIGAINWMTVAVIFVVGALLPLLVGFFAIRRELRVAPLTALGLVPGVRRWRVPLPAWIAAAVAACAGVALFVLAFISPARDVALLLAIGGIALFVLAFVFASRAAVSALLRVGVGVFGRLGITGRIAAGSLKLRQRFTCAAATALVVVVGLVVILQSGMAVVREQVFPQVYERDPVAISISKAPADGAVVPIPNGVRNRLAKMPPVTALILLNGSALTADGATWLVLGVTPPAANLPAGTTVTPTTEQAFVNPASGVSGPTITLSNKIVTRTLNVVTSGLAAPGQVLVAPSVLQSFGGPTQNAAVWLAVPDHSTAPSVASMTDDIVGEDPALLVSGAVYTVGKLSNAMTVLDAVAIGLAVVAAGIVIIGIGGALTLAVAGRRRESGLLQALGMRPGQLRSVVVTEALIVAVMATVAGIVGGWLLTWIGAMAAVQDPATIVPIVCANWIWPVGMLVLALVAGLVAAIGPGRRAAQAVALT